MTKSKVLFCVCMSWCQKPTDYVSGHSGSQQVRPMWILPGNKALFLTAGVLRQRPMTLLLYELMLLEAFKNCVSDKVVVYLNEQKVTTLQQVAVLAD